MLYRLLVQIGGLQALAQPAVRAALAAATAFALALALGRPTIAYLRRKKIGEKTEKTPIQDEALRASIAGKSGTPTMGGLFLVPALLTACLLWGDLSDAGTSAALVCTAALAGLGSLDDRLKLRSEARRDRGLKVRYKLVAQGIVGLAVTALLLHQRAGALVPVLHVSIALAAALFLGWGTLLVMTMSNSTNVTDGMDGLLAGLAPLAAAALGAAALRTAGPAAETAVLCGAIAGACLGFLCFNRHPAQVFMGDTGSLAIGGGLAVAALASGREVVLLVAGLLFLAEFGSSVLQIAAFQLFGRRVLPIAPMHHIWQKARYPERRIVHGFYLGGAAAALAGLSLVLL
jgi:phospho-N-acetylmuramoyl-pentapeptide-transferase